MNISLTKYISMDPDILGGAPVIKGTRIPIEVIQALLKQGQTIEMIQAGYPQVAPKKIQAIIAALMEIGLDDFKKTYKTYAAA